MPDNLDAVRRAIEDVVVERFPNVKIVRVDVTEGTDHDGDPSYMSRVVFEGSPDDFDRGRLAGITRHLRSRLRDIGAEAFPYTRFVARSELDGEAA